MKFKTVRIEPNNRDGCWSFSILSVYGDRENEHTIPNNLGFYHYPETIKDSDAFHLLKDSMIAAHQAEIDRMQKSLDMLKGLKFETPTSR